MLFIVTFLVLSLLYNPHYLLVQAQYFSADDHRHHSHNSKWNTLNAGLFVLLLIIMFYIFCRFFDRYQQLWLAHGTAHQAQLGLDPPTLETFPVFLYSEVSGLGLEKGPLECAVCLSPFEKGEKLLKLPKCEHVFHFVCVSRWLAGHTTCPCCRAELAPRPDDLTYTRTDCVDRSRTEAIRETVDNVV
ncbi:putative RING-H2 finger protein ATL35 [Bienertia sinuspersici]